MNQNNNKKPQLKSKGKLNFGFHELSMSWYKSELELLLSGCLIKAAETVLMENVLLTLSPF